jgi:hypothetical protein
MVQAVADWAPSPDNAPDPLFDDVLLLLMGEGTNGSTTFTDSSTYARSVTVGAGTPTISTAQSKYGSASIYGGSGSPQLFFSRAGTEWNQDNWCWDAWYRRAADGNYHGMMYHSANLIIRLRGPTDSGTYELRLIVAGAALVTSTTSTVIDEWIHLAAQVTKSGETYTVRLFVNGVLEATATSADTNLSFIAAASNVSIGRHDSGGFAGLNGYVDAYRITAGTRYTANFTPPASAANYLP